MAFFPFKRFGRKADQLEDQAPDRQANHPLLKNMKMETGSMMSYLGQELSGFAQKDLIRLDILRLAVEEAEIGYHRSCSPIESESQQQ